MASILAVASVSRAQDGGLDPAFGNEGIALTDFTGGSDGLARIIDLPDGRLLAAGSAVYFNPKASDYAVARYLPDGELDPTFASMGRLRAGFGRQWNTVSDVAVLPDGRFIVAGSTGPRRTATVVDDDVALARYWADGGLDTSFGSNGFVVTQVGAGSSKATDIEVLPDGRFVVAGSVSRTYTAPWFYDGFVIRYHADGSIDSSFGNSGTSPIQFGTQQSFFVADLTLQPDGRFVLCGGHASGTVYRVGLARLNPDGSPDASFGSLGRVSTAVPGDGFGAGVAIQPDGRIVVGGSAGQFPAYSLAVLRYETDGSLDASFAKGGRFVLQIGSSSGAGDVVLQADGRIIAGGSAQETTEVTDFALVRLTSSGAVDSTWGVDGVVRTRVAPWRSGIASLLLRPDGRLVAGGAGGLGSGDDAFALARYVATATSSSPLPGSRSFALRVSPNPSRGSLDLTYTAPSAENVRLTVHDVLGRQVALVHDGLLPIGEFRVTLDTGGLEPGMYTVRAVTGGRTATRTFTAIR